MKASISGRQCGLALAGAAAACVPLARASPATSAPAAPSAIVLRCGGLWDGRGGKTVGPMRIEVRAQHIVSVQPDLGAVSDGRVIDLSGLVCIASSSGSI